METAEVAQDVVLGMFLVNSHPATVLFDTGASHSFISSNFVTKHGLTTQTMKSTMQVNSPGGKLNTNIMCPRISVKIRGVEFPANPIILESEGLDVILGMSWLARWKGVIQCAERTVQLTTASGELVEALAPTPPSEYGAVNHLDNSTVQDIRVVHEYPDVFPDELPGMPPEREIEFVIDLLPGTAPIAKRPYRMAVKELEELKAQLKELQDKGYIRPSSSPWGAPVLFVEKKDGT